MKATVMTLGSRLLWMSEPDLRRSRMLLSFFFDQNLIIIILNAINCSAVFITWISKKEKKISWLIQKTKHLIRESKIPSIASRLNPPDVRGCTRPEHKIIRKYCSGNKGVRFTIFSVVCWQFSQIEIWATCHYSLPFIFKVQVSSHALTTKMLT